MPKQSCFEKPRSCWYGCLCVCGHGIMISLVIVKCELRSSELCESQTILPQSARSSTQGQTVQAPAAHIEDDEELLSAVLIPASEK